MVYTVKRNSKLHPIPNDCLIRSWVAFTYQRRGDGILVRIAICDDEPKILDEVSRHIEQYAKRNNHVHLDVCRFESAQMLINALDDGKTFDVFVLDVYIGNELGTTLAKAIRNRRIESPVVFLTTSLEHAPQSFETGLLTSGFKIILPRAVWYKKCKAPF